MSVDTMHYHWLFLESPSEIHLAEPQWRQRFPWLSSHCLQGEGACCTSSTSWAAPQCVDSVGAARGKLGGVGGLVIVYYSLVECICESAWLAHSAGWAVWVRAGRQIQTKTNTKTKTNKVHIRYSFSFFFFLLLLPLSRVIFCSSHLSLLVRCPGFASSLSSTLFLLGTFYPKHLLQCCVKVMCWLPYQEFS